MNPLAEFRMLNDKIDELQAKLKLAVEALEFYADKKYWDMAYRPDLKEFVPANSEGTSCVEIDKGRTAREALKLIKGDGE